MEYKGLKEIADVLQEIKEGLNNNTMYYLRKEKDGHLIACPEINGIYYIITKDKASNIRLDHIAKVVLF